MFLHFDFLGTMIFRKRGESDRAWARRRKSAKVKHRKEQRARFRDSQRTGIPMTPITLHIENNPWPLVTSFDAGKITTGTMSSDRLAAGSVTSENISLESF